MPIVLPTPENISLCATRLLNGELVSFPTETVYGLGADARSDTACQKIFDLKGRVSSNPLIVHLPSAEAVLHHLPPLTSRQEFLYSKLETLWPGPLSLIFPVGSSLSTVALAGGSSVAMRVPDHPVALALLRQVAIPLAAPSANISLHVSPTEAEHVEDDFGTNELLILDGGRCARGLESTVISLLNNHAEILRPGSISLEEIEELLGEQVKATHPSKQTISPGTQARHYSPQTPLRYAHEYAGRPLPPRTVHLRLDKKSVEIPGTTPVFLSEQFDQKEMASRLYAELRRLDKEHHDLILIDDYIETGLGRTIRDRIQRATQSASEQDEI